MICPIKRFFKWLFLKIERMVHDMAVIYVALIIKGKRKFSSVPAALKEQVREILIDLELEDLIDE